MMHPLDDDEIERARSTPIADVAARYALALKRAGVEHVGPCPVCGGVDRFSLSIRKNVFNCRGGCGGGDPISLEMLIAGCDFRTAVAELIGAEIDRDTDPDRDKRREAERARLAERQRQREEERRCHEAKQSAKAAWLWSQRVPITDGAPPALYLRRRGYAGSIPPTLGYLPPSDVHPPTMIAAFGLALEIDCGVIGSPVDVGGIHLTKLTADGHKAATLPNKITIGTSLGLPIVIAPMNDLLGLAITEGVEDALSVHAATGLGVWTAGAAGRMPALAAAVPDYTDCITIFAHDDAAGKRHALAFANALTRRIEVFMEGLTVSLRPALT
jgi:hypothetical protein